MSREKVLILAGDGIGPEIMKEAIKVLDIVSKKYSISFDLKEASVGGASIDRYGVSLTEEVLTEALKSRCVLL